MALNVNHALAVGLVKIAKLQSATIDLLLMLLFVQAMVLVKMLTIVFAVEAGLAIVAKFQLVMVFLQMNLVVALVEVPVVM